jgi:hypothetical protein
MFAINISFCQTIKDRLAVYVAGEKKYTELVYNDIIAEIVKSGKYTAIEREKEFLSKTEEEIKYQLNGNVEDIEIVKIGKQFGAQYVCIAKISSYSNYKCFISARLIKVETVEIESAVENTSYNCNDIDDLLLTGREVARKIAGVEKEKTENITEVERCQKEPYKNYAGWSLIGISYSGFYKTNISGHCIGTYLFGRYGNTSSWGWEAQIIGGAFGNYYNEEIDGLSFYGAVKYFPYKFIYVAVAGNIAGNHYGYNLQINNNGNFTIDNYKNAVFGISLLTGLEDVLYYGDSDLFGLHYGISFGMTYMFSVKSIVPMIHITISPFSLCFI